MLPSILPLVQLNAWVAQGETNRVDAVCGAFDAVCSDLLTFLFMCAGNVSSGCTYTAWESRVINAEPLSAVRDGEPLSDTDFPRLHRLVARCVRQQGGHLCAASRERCFWIADLPELPPRHPDSHELRQSEETHPDVRGKDASVGQSSALVSPSATCARLDLLSGPNQVFN